MNVDKADKMLKEAIDEALSILGYKAKEIVYYFLEKEYGLKREEIPSNLKGFHDGLHMLFGIGANVIEKHIYNCTQNKIGVRIRIEPEQDFVEILNRLKSFA
ncbi:MAG: hypothetical protein QXL89_01070 [Nitrososphaeria archaeon]